MARQIINNGTVANDKTGDTLRVAAGKINDNFIELYGLLGGDSSVATNAVSFADSGIVFNGIVHNSVLGVVEGSQKNTYLLNGASDTVTLNTATQTLTNKTINSPVLATPHFKDTSADHEYSLQVSELTGDRNINLPVLVDSDTFTFNNTSQTLTNKTITSPTISTPTITGHINDVNGAEVIEFLAASSAVNHVHLGNAPTGSGPSLSAQGPDSDIPLNLSGKNLGPVQVQSAEQFIVQDITSTAQAIQMDKVLTKFEAGGAVTATLADSVFIGQHKILANNGTGIAVITPTTFKNGTSITLRPKGAVQLLWIDNTDGWMIMGPKEYDSSEADALYFITA